MTESELKAQRRRKAAESLKAFRASNHRVDYFPTAQAWAAIERVRAEHPVLNLRQVLDRLVMAGERYFRK